MRKCTLVAVRADGGQCKACLANAQKITFLEDTVRIYLKLYEDLKQYTYVDNAIPHAPAESLLDFCYVLPDRVVILEVDENEHRYNTPERETRRQLELLNAVPADKHLVIVRFNPNPKRSDMWPAIEQLGSKLREAFVTDDVKKTDDGIHRIFINYSTARKRKLAQTAAADQLNALRSGPGARAPDSTAPDQVPVEAAVEQYGEVDRGDPDQFLLKTLEKQKLYAYHALKARRLARELEADRIVIPKKNDIFAPAGI